MTTQIHDTVSLSTASLTDLAETLTGRLLQPGDADYAALATPWNVAAISSPLAVIEVADAADVATTVRYAAAHGVDVAVQATGHGAAAYTRPTLLVHTRRLDEVTIRPEGSARVGAGVVWAQVLEAAAPYGLAGLAGSAPGVGVVGYLTGGGMGPVARTFGYASDHVTAFDVVTGDGKLRRATASENPALFWGLRGGKGALGIVTAVEFDLMPVKDIYGGAIYFDGANAAAVAQAWREWSQTLPEQASTSLALLRLPAMPMVPPPLADRLTVAVRFAWVGNPEDGARVAADIQGAAPALLGGFAVMPYAALGSIHADPVDPMPVHERFTLLRELPADAVAALMALAGPDSDCSQVIVETRLLGGAIARAGAPSAINHRDAAYTLMTIGIDIPPLAELTRGGAEKVIAGMDEWSYGAGQPNFSASSDPRHIARNYDAATLARLGSLARTYDPHGVLSAARGIRRATAD